MKVVLLGAMKVGGMAAVPIIRLPRPTRCTVPWTVTPASPSFFTGIAYSTQPALFLQGWKLRIAILQPCGGGVGVPVPGVLVNVFVGGTDVFVGVRVMVRVLVGGAGVLVLVFTGVLVRVAELVGVFVGPTGVLVRVGVMEGVFVFTGVLVDVLVMSGVFVRVGVTLGVFVFATVLVGVLVLTGVNVRVGVIEGVIVGVLVGVLVFTTVLVGVLVMPPVGVRVGVRVLVEVRVGVRIVGVVVGVLVGVSAVPLTVSVKSVNRAGSCMRLLLMSTISVSRVIGAGGVNCQWIRNAPGPIMHQPISATRNRPPHPCWQLGLVNAPAAYAPEPGSVSTPRKIQGPASPLHHSFWREVSKVVRSSFIEPVSTQVVVMAFMLPIVPNWYV